MLNSKIERLKGNKIKIRADESLFSSITEDTFKSIYEGEKEISFNAEEMNKSFDGKITGYYGFNDVDEALIEVNKIITLGNNEEYLVVDKVEKDDEEYYYIAQVNEEGTDIKDNYKIVCASYKDGEIYLDEVLGEDKLKAILPLFVKE